MRLRALRRLLLQNSVDHKRNGIFPYLRRELKKYITRLKHGKHTEEQRSKELKLGKEYQEQKQQLDETSSQTLRNKW